MHRRSVPTWLWLCQDVFIAQHGVRAFIQLPALLWFHVVNCPQLDAPMCSADNNNTPLLSLCHVACSCYTPAVEGTFSTHCWYSC